METSVIAEYDRFYGALLKAGLVGEWGFRARSEIFLGFARQIWAYDVAGSMCRGGKVLDIGCYAGYGESRISEIAREVVAIDTNTWAIDHASKSNKSVTVRFLVADALEMPFEDSSFDVVMAMQLFEHLEPSQTTRFLSNVRRILIDDGLCVMATPNKNIRIPLRKKPFNPEHKLEYTARTFADSLEAHFEYVTLMGVRASDWIEEIERRRVRNLAWKCYIGQPLAGVLSHLLTPESIGRIKESVFRRNLRGPGTETAERLRDEQFAKVIGQASLKDFFLVDDADSIEESLDLFAVAGKKPSSIAIAPPITFMRNQE